MTELWKAAIGTAVLVTAGIAATLSLSLFGGGGAAAAAGAQSGAQTLQVVERDFQIGLSAKRLAAGPVVIRVTNNGPDAHELIVVRDNALLPLRADGMTIDEDAVAKRIVGQLEPGPAGDVRELHVRLAAGRYMLLCNMYGHYMGGMYSVVIVR